MHPAQLDPARFDPAAFLRDHWQAAPLLLRQPWTRWTNPLDPDELAGLACEDAVESRLVTASPAGPTLAHGPFAADRLSALGTAPWTLLVQAANEWVPAVGALLDAFRFLPDWRVDDVMVSLAGDGGGVGPHVDRYDVFLIQGLGRRRWRIGAPLTEDADGPEGPLRLLPGFATAAEWVLEPGDILYLPPGVPHDGVALGCDCMTYSVGFRAPSAAELVAGWCDAALDRLDDGQHFRDPGLAAQANPGEITGEALERLHAMALDALGGRAAFARWFGTHATEPRDPETDWTPDDPPAADEIAARLAAGEPVVRNPAIRFAFVRDGDGVLLFVGGECVVCQGTSADLAERLCGSAELARTGLDDEGLALVERLFASGALGFEGDDEEE